MPHTSTHKIRKNAKVLRKNLTPADEKLWIRLHGYRMGDIHFRRQHAIGNYIVDFCSPNQKLIIELDGSQHLEQQEYDKERTAFLKSKGNKVLRFWNKDVMNNIDRVLTVIWDTLKPADRKQKDLLF